MQPFEEVYKQYQEMVFRFLLRLCRNRHLAEECCQETFYQALKGWKNFRGEGKVSTWLCTIARRVYYSNVSSINSCENISSYQKATGDIAEIFVERDRQMIAQRILHELPEPFREVFMLRTFCELNHGQIGELFGKTETWSRVTYHRARCMIQKAMEDNQ